MGSSIRMPRDSVPPRALLHRDAWIELGVTGRRLRSAEFQRVFAGWYTPSAAPASFTEMCRVVQTQVLPGAAIGFSSAAVQMGIALPFQLDDGVGLLGSGARWIRGRRIVPSRLEPGTRVDPFADIAELSTTEVPPIHAVRRTGTNTSAAGYIAHRMDPGPTVQRGDLVLCHALEVLLQLARDLRPWDLIAAIDSAIGPKAIERGIRRADVLEHARAAKGRPGAAALLHAATLGRENVESAGETRARLLIVAAGFPEPVPNLPIHVPMNGRTRRVDGGWEGPKVGFEYDGGWRRTSKKQWREDEARRDDLAALGWELRRLTRDDVKEPLPWLLKLRATFLARGMPAPSEEHIRQAIRALWADPPAADYAPPDPKA